MWRALPENAASLLVAWHTGRMTVPQGRLLQDDPSPSSNAVAIVSHGDRQRGGIAVLCIHVAAGAKGDEEQVRRVHVDLYVYCMFVLHTTLISMKYQINLADTWR